MLHIKLNGITNEATLYKIFYLQTLGVKRSKFNFFITILPADTPSPLSWDQKVKIQLFQIMAMLHIKLKGITNAATW